MKILPTTILYLTICFQANAQEIWKKVTTVIDQYPHPNSEGSKIVFHSNRTGHTEIYVINADGSGLTQLTSTKSDDSTPMFSPDGKKIVFVSNRDNDPEIYCMDADGTNQKRLTFQKGDDSHPHWSPDGKRIIFNSARTSPDINADWGKQLHEIFSMNADGTDVKQITQLKSICTYPSFSPDGSKISFRHFTFEPGFAWDFTNTKRNSEIFVMDADGKNPTNLSKSSSYDGWPCFSPDGKRIVFSSNRQGPANTGQLYVINIDGTELKQLTTGPGGFAIPWWTKDGTKIYAYQYWETENYEFGNLVEVAVPK